MTASIAGTLTNSQLQQAQQQAAAIANSAKNTISSNQFVFFAAFDGTNNNTNDPSSIPVGEQKSNVGQLWDQVYETRATNPNIGGNYYAGPGSSGTLTGSSAIPSKVTQEAINTGTRAYTEFQDQALAWLQQNQSANPLTEP